MELIGEHEPGTGALEPGASAATCRPRDLWEAVRWVRDVARGVHDAHLRNVFHRDLKPHNVLITPLSRRAKIADFGLAVSGTGRAARSRSADACGRRTPGPYGAFRAGARPRAAPSARAGRPRHTLVAVDVWGLGAIGLTTAAPAPPWPCSDGSGLGARRRGIDCRRSPPWAIASGWAFWSRSSIARAARPGDRYPSAGALATAPRRARLPADFAARRRRGACGRGATCAHHHRRRRGGARRDDPRTRRCSTQGQRAALADGSARWNTRTGSPSELARGRESSRDQGPPPRAGGRRPCAPLREAETSTTRSKARSGGAQRRPRDQALAAVRAPRDAAEGPDPTRL
jgi:hypothetical protein